MSDGVLIGLGCASLGAVIGGIIGHYIAHVKEFTLRSLVSVVAILGGAGVVKLFDLMGSPPTVYFWLYPVGLLVGLGGVASLHFKDPNSN